MFRNFNVWFLSSLLVSIIVSIPILTVLTSFFEDTSNYYEILKDTFLFEYVSNSFILLFFVLIFTFLIGTTSAYLVSFFEFPLSNFFKWALILSFAVLPYIYAYSLTAFFENYGTAFTILKNLFGDGNYNNNIPKFDGMFGAILSISFSLYAYVYILARASFLYQSQNLIDLGKNLGFSKFKSFVTEKGYEKLIVAHQERNLPLENFIESYRRYAKSLVAYNGIEGKDKKTGLLFEFVLSHNPYGELKDNIVEATLFYKKRPYPQNLVSIFIKNENNISLYQVLTDDKGRFSFSINPGESYLLDSVIIIPKKGNPLKKEPIWHSIWASTTFSIPKTHLDK